MADKNIGANIWGLEKKKCCKPCGDNESLMRKRVLTFSYNDWNHRL